jgi:hypothetical protein
MSKVLRMNTSEIPEHRTAFAETLRRSKDPLALLTFYESRLSRRLLPTLKQLREIQAERRALEQQQLEELYLIAAANPELAETLSPSKLGFVCSTLDWQHFYRRKQLLKHHPGGRTSVRAGLQPRHNNNLQS